jgi:hypothetical protein
MDLKPYNEQEFNKLCAEFLGWEQGEDGRYWKETPTESSNWYVDEMYFHSDWNWIMEVKKAIESVRLDVPNYNVIEWFEVHLYSRGCLIKSGLRHVDGETTSPYYYENSVWKKDLQESTVQAIWQFINWYNEQKQ